SWNPNTSDQIVANISSVLSRGGTYATLCSGRGRREESMRDSTPIGSAHKLFTSRPLVIFHVYNPMLFSLFSPDPGEERPQRHISRVRMVNQFHPAGACELRVFTQARDRALFDPLSQSTAAQKESFNDQEILLWTTDHQSDGAVITKAIPSADD